MKTYKLVSRNDATGAIWVYEILYERGEIKPRYFHDRPELVVVLCGEVDMTFGEEQHHFRKGDVVFVASGIEHRNVIVKRPARIFRCTVSAAHFARAGFDAPVTVIRSELLEGALSRLVSEARLSDRGMPLALEAAALAVLAAARRVRERRPGPDREEKIEGAIRLVRDTSYTLGEIAGRSGFYDHAHLTRAFRRHLGITPAEYRRRHTFSV
jgi:quercetin dioxygenase-like cupin family protein